MCHNVQILYSEKDDPARRVSVTISKLLDSKKTVDVKEKERAAIEFLQLERCANEEIVIHLWNVYGAVAYCRTSVFRWINEVRRAKKEL
jgi:hypothetical protein